MALLVSKIKVISFYSDLDNPNYNYNFISYIM